MWPAALSICFGTGGWLQAGSACRVRQSRSRIVMKNQRPTQAKNAQKLSDAIIAKRYLDSQRLPDEVKKVEQSCGMRALKAKKTRRSVLRRDRESATRL